GSVVQLGLDVSSRRGTIDWSRVSSSGRKFAFVKATEGTYFTGPSDDPGWFKRNIEAAKSAQLLVGADQFSVSLHTPGIDRAIAEARYFLAAAQPYIGPGYLPPILDIEDHPYPADFPDDSCLTRDVNGNPTGLDLVCKLHKDQLSGWVRAWVKEVENATGVK